MAAVSPRKRVGASTGGRAVTPDWLDGTNRLLVGANESQLKSCKLRDQSTQMRTTYERETRERATDVNNLLREKVAETMGLKNKLEKALSDIMNEIQTLTSTKVHTVKVCEAKQMPLRVAEKRAGVRRQRPDRENINDTVERALNTETLDLKTATQQLATGVAQAEDLLAKMDNCKRLLAADLDDKTRSAKLDQDCLNVLSDPSAGQQPMNNIGAAVNLQPKRSGVAPEQWRSSTNKLVSTSDELRSNSAKLCKQLRQLVKATDNATSKANTEVNTALRGKVKQTTRLHADLSRRLQETNQEIYQLTEQRTSVSQALADKQGPLRVLQQRLGIRRQRPQRESVRDKVEEAMEAELAKLSAAVRDLDTKGRNIDQQLAELREAKRQLELDIGDKTHALSLDKQCLEIDVERGSLLSARSGRSDRSRGSVRSTPRSLSGVM